MLIKSLNLLLIFIVLLKHFEKKVPTQHDPRKVSLVFPNSMISYFTKLKDLAEFLFNLNHYSNGNFF